MAEKCTACSGTGWYYSGDWKRGYPKATCEVCQGSGIESLTDWQRRTHDERADIIRRAAARS